MADTKNFRVEHGINIGTTEVVNSSGKVQASAVSTLDTEGDTLPEEEKTTQKTYAEKVGEGLAKIREEKKAQLASV